MMTFLPQAFPFLVAKLKDRCPLMRNVFNFSLARLLYWNVRIWAQRLGYVNQIPASLYERLDLVGCGVRLMTDWL